MKKFISLLLIAVSIAALFSLTGCKPDQEEFRAEYIKKLGQMSLTINTSVPFPESELMRCEQIADDLTIAGGMLELYIHCHEIYEPECEKITYHEITSLYYSYDEDIYNRFNELFKWVTTGNGRDFFVFDYRKAMFTANELYKEKHGAGFFSDDDESNWTIEERINFEEFIRNNPDFMPAEEYEKELRRLGIE